MKRTLFIIMLFFSVLSYSQQNVPNGNFEIWSDQYTPEGWDNSIVFGTPPFSTTIYTAQRVGNAFQGNYAAKLQTQEFLTYKIPGLLQLGDVNISGEQFGLEGGLPFTDRPLGMSVFVRYVPVENDTAIILAYFTKYDEISGTTDTIGGTLYPIFGSIMDYTELLMPIIFKSDENPDTMNIVFLSSNPFNPKVGSALFIDSLQLLYEISAFPTLAMPATKILDTTFTANWIPSPYSNEYVFQMATDTNFVNVIPDFDNIIADTFSFDIVIPSDFQNLGKYFYRVQVKYGDTATSVYSNVIRVIPTYPTTCFDAIDLTDNSFRARWLSMPDAISYNLEVATDTMFTNLVSGYENLSITDTSYNVSGLTESTKYYYRVKTVYPQGISPYSNIVVVSTLTDINELSEFKNYIVKSNEIYLYNLLGNSEIIIYDANGKIYYKNNTNTSEIIIPIYQKGIYLMEIITENKIWRLKFTI